MQIFLVEFCISALIAVFPTLPKNLLLPKQAGKIMEAKMEPGLCKLSCLRHEKALRCRIGVEIANNQT
jgi:hypothetical protein